MTLMKGIILFRCLNDPTSHVPLLGHVMSHEITHVLERINRGQLLLARYLPRSGHGMR